jgi:hypothetical protein
VSETPRDAAPDEESAPDALGTPEASDDQVRDSAGRHAGASAAEPVDGERRARRRRRLIVAGVAVGAALIMFAICAGGLALLSAVGAFTDDARDGRQQAHLRDISCLDLEGRLNRVAPPGSTVNPAGRAAAIRNENAALRPYLGEVELRGDREETLTGWRQLLDARTAYAEALDKQAPSRTPAFFLAPRAGDGLAVADQLAQRSPAACAGSIRRLAAPDL